MKPGNINQYAYLSEFKTVQDFNETIKQVVATYGDQFTKSEKIAFLQLTRYSVKKIGICNARICKLVEATQDKKGGISRSTFERMLRKAKQLGILSIHHTTREKGGFSHSVYVFHRFDGANSEKLTERKQPIVAAITTGQAPVPTTETSSIKNKIIKDQLLRPSSLETLDYTYTPSSVPEAFVKTVKPFFSRAKQICQLWDRTMIAYRTQKFDETIDMLLPTIIKAFKETVYKYKSKKIKTSFNQYYYGTVVGMLAVEKRRVVAQMYPERWGWLEG
ncbi:hypothetical protein AWH56_021815 [Anaerobacillus isosaccharinicus]|uniref:Helix-turn-helix domain-containing protein n=1 Tax=Anaerobacillus isosaccharinicus TaxID=1532552 RepID=A0A1S2MEP7_9BACI|nr:hypothetical protein [Anaerobacillus isosaccharinicus]MBA5586459.1 hypothetical protein [Anaerobacillus isosaccharinicus]QOY35298.1 hypothetical protein AWH56_021815 [Anaerobacillus isosaccharinicus]